MTSRHLWRLCCRTSRPSFLSNSMWSVGGAQQKRFIDLQEYQSKKIMSENGLTVQRFRVIQSLKELDKELQDFNCDEYVIKAQVLAGGRGKGSFKRSGMKGGVKLTKDKHNIKDLGEFNVYHQYESITK